MKICNFTQGIPYSVTWEVRDKMIDTDLLSTDTTPRARGALLGSSAHRPEDPSRTRVVYYCFFNSLFIFLGEYIAAGAGPASFSVDEKVDVTEILSRCIFA